MRVGALRVQNPMLSLGRIKRTPAAPGSALGQPVPPGPTGSPPDEAPLAFHPGISTVTGVQPAKPRRRAAKPKQPAGLDGPSTAGGSGAGRGPSRSKRPSSVDTVLAHQSGKVSKGQARQSPRQQQQAAPRDSWPQGVPLLSMAALAGAGEGGAVFAALGQSAAPLGGGGGDPRGSWSGAVAPPPLLAAGVAGEPNLSGAAFPPPGSTCDGLESLLGCFNTSSLIGIAPFAAASGPSDFSDLIGRGGMMSGHMGCDVSTSAPPPRHPLLPPFHPPSAAPSLPRQNSASRSALPTGLGLAGGGASGSQPHSLDVIARVFDELSNAMSSRLSLEEEERMLSGGVVGATGIEATPGGGGLGPGLGVSPLGTIYGNLSGFSRGGMDEESSWLGLGLDFTPAPSSQPRLALQGQQPLHVVHTGGASLGGRRGRASGVSAALGPAPHTGGPAPLVPTQAGFRAPSPHMGNGASGGDLLALCGGLEEDVSLLGLGAGDSLFGPGGAASLMGGGGGGDVQASPEPGSGRAFAALFGG